MALDYASNLGWHDGEQQMQKLLHVPPRINPTSSGLTPYGLRTLHSSPLMALGTLDDDLRPWTTLLGGQPGFARSLGQSIVSVKTVVDRKYDPVMQLLLSGEYDGKIIDEPPIERPVSGLAINLMTRERLKLSGRMTTTATRQRTLTKAEEHHVGEVHLTIKVEQSLGNCPKYLNQKQISNFIPQPKLRSSSLPLHQSAVNLLAKADMFFISSSEHHVSIGTNHRGGPPGFVRLLSNNDSATVLVWPEYSGNRFYQTLGNLKTTPMAGLIFPDFDTGDVLYLTCTTEVSVGKEVATLIPRSNLAVKAYVSAVRFVSQGLAFRGELGEQSPYNPPVRFLTSEDRHPMTQSREGRVAYAKIRQKDILTPTIARLRFSISDPDVAGQWNPGQYVALAFEDELSAGYSHMRDDDPQSLNDDFVRTFTVSSTVDHGMAQKEFEITFRNVGVVTGFLFRQHARAGLEVPLKGFGRSFTVKQVPGLTVPIVAGGIGITPILAHLPYIDLARVRLFWAINVQDIGLVIDTFLRHPALAPSTTLYISGNSDNNAIEANAKFAALGPLGVSLVMRRIVASDVQGNENVSSTWYICTGKDLRQSLMNWLSGRHFEFEDFDY